MGAPPCHAAAGGAPVAGRGPGGCRSESAARPGGGKGPDLRRSPGGAGTQRHRRRVRAGARGRRAHAGRPRRAGDPESGRAPVGRAGRAVRGQGGDPRRPVPARAAGHTGRDRSGRQATGMARPRRPPGRRRAGDHPGQRAGGAAAGASLRALPGAADRDHRPGLPTREARPRRPEAADGPVRRAAARAGAAPGRFHVGRARAGPGGGDRRRGWHREVPAPPGVPPEPRRPAGHVPRGLLRLLRNDHALPAAARSGPGQLRDPRHRHPRGDPDEGRHGALAAGHGGRGVGALPPPPAGCEGGDGSRSMR